MSEHLRSFVAFRHLVVFAALHVALTLSCVALAFLGHAKLIAFLLWLGGTLLLTASLATHEVGALKKSAQPHNLKQSL
jgi:hypothetical protein